MENLEAEQRKVPNKGKENTGCPSGKRWENQEETEREPVQ